MGIKILVFFASTLIASVVSDDCFDYGTDYNGFDMEEGVYIPQASAEDCQIECQNTAGCEYWTWDPGKLGSLWGNIFNCHLRFKFFFLDYNNACWKKTAKGENVPSGSMVSGPKYCGVPPEPNPNKI